MMKRPNLKMAATLLTCGAFLCSSCIGSFGLHSRLLSWNQNIDDNKFVNELAFFALAVVQAYTVSWLADAIILNSVEFWTGTNPMASIGEVKKGIAEEEALDYALSQVNNVSKKRLLGSLESMKARLLELEPPQEGEKRKSPFWEMMAKESRASAQKANNYSGIYMSYSLSSSRQALKAEPYLICPSENSDYVKVVHNSAYNLTHYGTCLFSNHQNAYLFFNEREAPQIALFTIYLQLPMYDFPHLLKGLYLSLDYNRNPIARRILFVKHSDSTSMDDFLELKGRIIPQEELTDELLPYYNYTCQKEDCIKTCSVPSPRLDASDLEREKKLLEI